MGCRANVVKTYIVEYADGQWFNWQAEPLLELLRGHDIEVWQANENDPYSDWEIQDIEGFKRLIEALEQKSSDERCKPFEALVNSEVAEVFKEWLKYVIDGGEFAEDFIRVHWF